MKSYCRGSIVKCTKEQKGTGQDLATMEGASQTGKLRGNTCPTNAHSFDKPCTRVFGAFGKGKGKEASWHIEEQEGNIFFGKVRKPWLIQLQSQNQEHQGQQRKMEN